MQYCGSGLPSANVRLLYMDYYSVWVPKPKQLSRFHVGFTRRSSSGREAGEDSSCAARLADVRPRPLNP
jgi:hypothetical protein